MDEVSIAVISHDLAGGLYPDGTRSGQEVKKSRWVDFPLRVFPNPVSDYVKSAARAMGCDTAFIAIPLLSGFFSCGRPVAGKNGP